MGNQEQDVGLCVWVCNIYRGCAIVCLTFPARLVGVAQCALGLHACVDRDCHSELFFVAVHAAHLIARSY